MVVPTSDSQPPLVESFLDDCTLMFMPLCEADWNFPNLARFSRMDLTKSASDVVFLKAGEVPL